MKKFLICLSILFSFSFIGNVKAVYIKGFNVSQEFLENYFEQNFEGKRANQISSSDGTNLVFHKEDFPFVNCYGYNNMGSSSGDKTLSCQYLYFITPKSFNTNYIVINTGTNKYGIIPGFTYNITKNTFTRPYQSGSSKTAYDSIFLTNNAFVNTSTISYTNFEVYNGSTLVKSKNLDYDSSGKKNISFHLNGGTAFDNSNPLSPVLHEEDYSLEMKETDLNTYLESLNLMKNKATFLGWYLDTNLSVPYNGDFNMLDISQGYQNGYISSSNVFTSHPQTALFNQKIYLEPGKTYTFSTKSNVYNMVISFYDSNDNFLGRIKKENINKLVYTTENSVSYVRFAVNIDNNTITEQKINNAEISVIGENDLYAKWETPKTFNFHLNGGYLYDPSDGWGSEEDFSISLYNSEIEQFFTNLEVKKASMLFDGWFYDNNYKNIFHINDNFTEDTYNLYAKWRYEKVDDFLNNTTFNEYTFDTMYDYAIITKGDKLGDIYLGLNLNKYEITVYEYNENLSNYEKEKGFCLVPIYSKNGTYYYNLDTSSTSYTEVLVLPKTVFENNNYSFLLTDNAYITYTNNLEDTVIYDSNGNQINTNLEDTYQTFQDSMISDEHDLLTIFKNLTKFKDNNVFSNINTIWNKFKKTDLYTYFMILIVGGLIILIIKGAKRS